MPQSSTGGRMLEVEAEPLVAALPVVAALIDALGTDVVLTGAAVSARARNFWDSSPLQALAIVRPRSTDQVAAALHICHEHRQTVVPQGGRTGVCDGDRSTPQDIVLSLERMTAIEEIDPIGRTVQVQAGCVLERLQEAVAAQGLFLPLDLGARGSCTIGGNVATNAGGINVIRYGMTRALVVGLEAVLADGTVLSSLSPMLKNNSGYDLKHLFIGTEGTLGIVTRVVLSLKEHSSSALSALVALDDAAHIAALLKHMDRHLAGSLSSFEVMWGGYFRAVTEPGGHAAPMSREHPYYVVMEAQGADPKADEERFIAVLERAVDSGWVADAVLPKSQSERDRIWAIREDFSSILTDQPQFLYDVSLPIKQMIPYVETVSNDLRTRWPGHRLHVIGHIGDGNLHFFISPGGAGADLHQEVDAVVYGPLAQFSGVPSAEHGIGLEKKRWLPLFRSAAEMATMRLLKRSLDPRNILNRGKIFDLDRID